MFQHHMALILSCSALDDSLMAGDGELKFHSFLAKRSLRSVNTVKHNLPLSATYTSMSPAAITPTKIIIATHQLF